MSNIISFDIVVNEPKKTRTSCFHKLVEAIRGKVAKPRRAAVAKNIMSMYNKLKEEQQNTFAFRINDADLNFEFVSSTEKKYYESSKKLNLMSDFEQIIRMLDAMCSKPKKEDVYEIEIVFEKPKPKPKKLVKVTTFDKISIFERWVKIGYEMYRRQLDSSTGDEYIVVDGDIYYIKYDRQGKEYLA